MTRRREKVQEAIRRIISSVIQNELRDPRIGFVTVTKVQVTPDLRLAKIFYSVLGDEKTKKSTKIALQNANHFLKMKIGDELKLRFTPEVSFREDIVLEYSQKIEDILTRIKKEKKNGIRRRRGGDKKTR